MSIFLALNRVKWSDAFWLKDAYQAWQTPIGPTNQVMEIGTNR